MLAQHGSGMRSDALDSYQRLYRTLDRELGIEPMRDIQDLHQRILRNDDALVETAPPLLPV